MPLIQITAPTDVLDKGEQNELINRVSNAVLKAEGADTHDSDAQSLVWAYYIENPISNSYVGGENLDKPPFIVSIVTPQGALNEVTRGELVKSIGEIINDLVGVFNDRLNHWTMMHEVNEGSWGGSGQVFNLAGIQSAMNIKAA
ncbi:MAG: hypothetical protein QNL62_12270 [Gammaproteobacteria bacterium]|nr:hypothetical protein [Gammaproteobacteria bacterium]